MKRETLRKRIEKDLNNQLKVKKIVGNLAVVRLTNMPAILTEIAYIDSKDAEWLKNNNFIKDIAAVYARGVAKYLDLPFKIVTANKEDPKVAEHDISKVSDWEKATLNGYLDGTRPGAPITREEIAVVINRLRRNLLEK
ncbi:N-acetylmuramoyl-L-alanine amidase [Peribacillus loiseleuriae]|uniref:N-acetylmuramoyl-L-alanine amidase n=1 Tax=Peribacillus loiseleuriae TaxID=1679170 RepID=UPI0038043E13